MTGRLRLRVFRLDRQLCGAEIRTADVSSGPRVTVRRHASNLPLGGPGGGSPPASRSGRAATGLVSDRKLTEFTPKQSGSPCSRPGPTDPVQSLRSGSLSAISSHSVWNESHPKRGEPSVDASQLASSTGYWVGVPAASARNWSSQQRFISTNHQVASSTDMPVVKMPWPAWIATFLSRRRGQSARRTRCLAPVSGRGSRLAGHKRRWHLA